MSGCSVRQFKGVPVGTTAGKEPLISKGQFYQALTDSITHYTRLLPESEKTLSKAIEVLDVAAVASDVPREFGEAELKLLCTTFGLGFSDAKNA